MRRTKGRIIKVIYNENVSEILMERRKIKHFTNRIIILSSLYKERQ